MKRSLDVSISLGLALIVAACGTSSPATPGAGGQSNTSHGGSTGTPGTGGSSTVPGAGGATNGVGGGSNGVGGSATGTSGGSNGSTGGSATGTSGGSNGTTGGSTSTGTAGSAPTAGTSSTGGGGSVTPVTLPDVVTSADGAFWKVGTLTAATGTADVTADDGSLKQRWDGFGGTFNEAGWDALSVLTDAERVQAMKWLFDAADGANFAFGRLPIGASDYAMKRYTLAEMNNDFTMASFTIAQDKKLLIPFIKAGLAVKPDIKLRASPWTPPAWMKSNNSTDDGKMKDDKDVLNAFALYLEKFVQAYAAEGLTISAVHPQNEPGYVNPYPSCSWTGELYIRFIRDYLGPLFAKDKVPAEIWCGTMSNQTDGMIAQDLAKDSKALAVVKGFGMQWNTDGSVAALKSTNLPIWQTEHRCGNYDFDSPNTTRHYDPNKPQNDFAYGVESWKNIKDWIGLGVNGYSAWNMVLDTLGTNLNATKPWHQNALLVVDRNAKKLIQTPAYFVFRHLSQFVQPKANLIGSSGGDALAFKNPDGTIVVVMYNSGAAKTAIVSLGGTKFSFAMPANGWATVHHKK